LLGIARMSGADDGGDDKASAFEARLRAARERQGLGPAPRAGPDDSPLTSQGSALGVGMRVGVELLSSLVVAVAIGWALDRWLHTRPVFLGIFVLLGGAAGVLNVWRLVGPEQGRARRRGGR
jgi:ATP synthase protein I